MIEIIQESGPNGYGHVKIYGDVRVVEIYPTVNPNYVTLLLSQEVHSLYEGDSTRNNDGFILTKSYQEVLNIPEKYRNWNTYVTTNYSVDNISVELKNKLDIKVGTVITNANLLRYKYQNEPYPGATQVLAYKLDDDDQITYIRNRSGIHPKNQKELETFLKTGFSNDDEYYPPIDESTTVTFVEAYFPVYSLHIDKLDFFKKALDQQIINRVSLPMDLV
jgi:hypothetical protein